MNRTRAIVAILICLCAAAAFAVCPLNRRKGTKLEISSNKFMHNGIMPAKYTCDGDDVNPPLQISGIPAAAKSLALIVDDPDAPATKPAAWVHWVVWNIPPSTTSIAERSVPGLEGMTDFHRKGFGGPCPPSGTHRYFFKLYALDTMLDLPEGTATKTDLEKAMNGHILSQATLIGLYQRQK